jgi:3-dehydro-L-gulonate 2-dehydrogenase
MPMGFWKGSGLSIVLDMIATLLSGGLSVAEVTEEMDDEYNVSQIFIAISVDKLIDRGTRDQKLKRITDYVLEATRSDPDVAVRMPGHEFPGFKAQNIRDGIPVDETVWQRIRAL